MKKFKIIPILLFIALIVTACNTSGNTSKQLTSEEVIENVSDSFDEIDSLSQEIALYLTNDFNNVVETITQTLNSTLIYEDNTNITHIYTANEVISQNQRNTMQFYKTPKGIFIHDGVAWQEYSGPEDYSSTYKNVLNSFLSVSSEFEMTENSDSYQFIFRGQDGNVFRTIGKPYSLIFNGFSDDDVELDVEFIMDKENFLITDVTVSAIGDYGDGNIADILTTVNFYDFNGVDEGNFPVPEDLNGSGDI